MKTLSTQDIECLLEIRASDRHPLEILGYSYTSEGAQRFRAERSDVLPQIVAHVQSVLRATGIFPPDVDTLDAGWQTFIRREGDSFVVSSMEETGVSRHERITSLPMPEDAAIRKYIRRVANPDYVSIPDATA